jgi:hypothetical protein
MTRPEDKIYGLDNTKSETICERLRTGNKMVCYVIHGLPTRSGMSNLFLQRASFKFKNVVRAAVKKHDNDELKLYLYTEIKFSMRNVALLLGHQLVYICRYRRHSNSHAAF